MIRRINLDVLSTATTMSRRPGFISGQAWSNGHAWGTFSGASGQFSCTSSGGAQVFGMSPIGESNTVLPPRAVAFSQIRRNPSHSQPDTWFRSIGSSGRACLLGDGAQRSQRKGAGDRKPEWKPW
jgi:hypothetical protein